MVLPRNMVEIAVPSFGFSIRVKIIHSYKSIHKSIFQQLQQEILDGFDPTFNLLFTGD